MKPANRFFPFLRVSRRLRSDESGFTLVEIVIATGVIMTALVMMGGVLTSGLAGTAVARERQSANGLANQTLEHIRALPFETLERGHDTADLAAGTDPNIQTSGCASGAYCFQGEQLVAGTNSPVDPLVPHQKTASSGDSTNKTFTISSYVTYYENDTASNTYRVSVYVTWKSPVRGSSSQNVKAQTIIFPNGCLSLPAHPYSGPCQAAFTAAAMAAQPTITFGGHVGGVNIAKAVSYAGAASSDATIEQTSRVGGLTQASGAVLQASGGSEQTIGQTSAASQADNDPSAANPTYQSANLPGQAGASTALISSSGSLTADTTTGDSGRTTSTTAANLGPCPNLPSPTTIANEVDSLPCGGSSSTTASTTTMNATLTSGDLNITSFPLASMGSQSGPNTAIVDRATSTGVDSIRATLSRSAIDFKLGGLQSSLRPDPSFDYFVKVSGYTDSATSETGLGAGTATNGPTGGTVTYWSGAGYQSLDLATISGPTTFPTLDFSPSSGTQVVISATLSPESKTATTAASPAGCTTACSQKTATAKMTPATISVSQRIVHLGQTVLDVTMNLDPGSIQAKTSYVAAPTS